MDSALHTGLVWQAAIIALLGLSILLLTLKVRRLNAILPPAGALMLSGGPAVGSHVKSIEVSMLDGHARAIGSAGRQKQQLLFFFSMTCPISRTLLPVVRSFERDYDVVFATDEDSDQIDHAAFAQKHKLSPANYSNSEALGRAFGIGRVPQAVLIDRDGKIKARGLVNNREHLDSLVNAANSDTQSIQAHLARQQA